MKAVFSLLALATTALAANVPRNGYPQQPPPSYVATTTQVEVTYTTVCPVTSTYTKGGETHYTTYTTTSTVYTKVPTVIYQTVTGPPVTQATQEVAYTTITSLCPVTETKTVSGKPVIVTYTTTSTIVVSSI